MDDNAAMMLNETLLRIAQAIEAIGEKVVKPAPKIHKSCTSCRYSLGNTLECHHCKGLSNWQERL